jgi:hypothetical protein
MYEDKINKPLRLLNMKIKIAIITAKIPSPTWVKYLKKVSNVGLPTNAFIFICRATLSN